MFITYRLLAEHFDGIYSNGSNPKLRDFGSIVIEDNVFISSNAVILSNVVIGKNRLVLEGAVVSTSFTENSVIKANPAICVGKQMIGIRVLSRAI